MITANANKPNQVQDGLHLRQSRPMAQRGVSSSVRGSKCTAPAFYLQIEQPSPGLRFRFPADEFLIEGGALAGMSLYRNLKSSLLEERPDLLWKRSATFEKQGLGS